MRNLLRKRHLSTLNPLINWRGTRIKLLVQGICVGLMSGLVVVLYRYWLGIATQGRLSLLQLIRGNPLLILASLIGLALMGLAVGWLVRVEPMISGSGIPQVEGQLMRRIDMKWWRVVLGKLVGGVMSLGAGLSLGREGPSVQIGAATGLGLSRIFGGLKYEQRYLVTAGASAGLAAAFNAPLAGIIFAVEEVHRHFSPLILVSAATAALMADFVSKEFFGLGPVFSFHNISALPLHLYALLLGLGVLVGVVGVFFNRSLMGSLRLFEKAKWLPDFARPVLPFVAVGVLALVLPQVIGGGHGLIESVVDTRIALGAVALFFVVKFLFTVFCYGSGAPGGIFLPLLALGALLGNIYGQSLVGLLGISTDFVNNFTILAMAGMFASIVRAPITGTILITDMTGSFSHLLALAIVSITAHITADLLRSEPVYESLLGRLLAKQRNEEEEDDNKSKSLLEIPVFMDSEFDGKEIKELDLPFNCLLVGISRGGEDLIPRGNTVIQSGDILTVLTPECSAPRINSMLQAQAAHCNLQIS